VAVKDIPRSLIWFPFWEDAQFKDTEFQPDTFGMPLAV
jgi:hypothetical protein